MCGPVALGVTSIAIALVGGYAQYDASKNAQAYNEQVADQNSKVAGAQAVDAERLGQIAESERRLKTRMQIATQETGFAAQNVATTGSALEILGDTAMFGEIDVGRIRSDAQRKAWGFRMDQYGIEANKRLDQFKGKAQRTGIILSTASSVAGVAGGMWGTGGGGNYGQVQKGLKSGRTVGTVNNGSMFGNYA